MTEAPHTRQGKSSNGRVAFLCTLFFATMLGVSYAAVPLYDLFCRVTGFGGTPMIAESAPEQLGKRKVLVRFDTNVAPGLSWSFKPEMRQREVTLGETVLVNYVVTNTSSQESWGTASYNVTPELSGSYFAKLQCFCFTSQSLGAGESMTMPVVFFVDPAMDEDKNLDKINTITLSYTFFAAKKPVNAAQKAAEDNTEKPL